MKLVVGCYSQLPFGTPEMELEQVLSNVIKPLLTMIYQKPQYKLILKLSMNEVLWFEEKHPEVNMLIDDLVRKGQIELLTGFYFDCLPINIPPHERSAQIEKTTTFLRKRFSKRSRGLFCYNQNWSPSIVSTMKVCSLKYVVISTWSHSLRKVMEKKPFFMNEMGNTVTVFPTDNRYNELLANFFMEGNAENSFNDFLSGIRDISPDKNCGVNTIMLNADQMLISTETWNVFGEIYSKFEELGTSSCLLNEIDLQNDIWKRYHLREDCYGFDYQAEREGDFQSILLKDKQLNQLYGRQLAIRDMIKSTKKSAEGRKRIDQLLMQSSTGAPFEGVFRKFPPIIRKIEKTLSEIEGIIANKCPHVYYHEFDIDIDRIPEYIYRNKRYFAFLDRKGASISNLTIINNGINQVQNDNSNLFTDFFVLDNGNQKAVRKVFDITLLDKRYNEFLLNSNSIRVGNRTINIQKHFKFRSSTIVLETQITNISSDNFDCVHGIEIPIVFSSSDGIFFIPGDPIQPLKEETKTKKFVIHDIPTKNIIFIATSAELTFHSNQITKNYYTPVGLQKINMYTNITLKENLHLEPGESKTLTIGLRIEKNKI